MWRLVPALLAAGCITPGLYRERKDALSDTYSVFFDSGADLYYAYVGDAVVEPGSSWTGSEQQAFYRVSNESHFLRRPDVYTAVCEWTSSARDWDHEPAVDGTDPMAGAICAGCEWAFTVHIRDAEDTTAGACGRLGILPPPDASYRYAYLPPAYGYDAILAYYLNPANGGDGSFVIVAYPDWDPASGRFEYFWPGDYYQ